METIKSSASLLQGAHFNVVPPFADIENVIKQCTELSAFHPSIRFIIAIEFLGVTLDNESYDIFNFCIHQDYGKNYCIEGEYLNCQLFLDKRDDNELENVSFENASVGLDLQIPLANIWLVLAKTPQDEQIIFRG